MTLSSRLAAAERVAPPARMPGVGPIADRCPACKAAVFIAHPIAGARRDAVVGLCTLCRCHFLTHAAMSYLNAEAECAPSGPLAEALRRPVDAFVAVLAALGIPDPAADYWRAALAGELEQLRRIHDAPKLVRD